MFKQKKIINIFLILTFLFSIPLTAKTEGIGVKERPDKASETANNIANDIGIQTLDATTNNPEPWMKKLARWSFIIFAGIFMVAILIGGTLYAIMPQGNQWKDNGLKMIQGAIIAGAIALASGLIWGLMSAFFSK